jgi:hypothetical protein
MERVDDKIILKGVLQTFDRLGSNGRIYPETYHAEAYEKLLKRLVPDERIRKINSLRSSWK